MSEKNESLVAELCGVVGDAHVLTEGDLSAWLVDWRGTARGHALAVVRPGTTQEVAAVVRACAQRGVALIPQGGNTGLVGGSVPDSSGTQVLLCLTRLNRVRSIDVTNLTMTAEAGCVLQVLRDFAAERGLMLPLSMASEGSCTLGGNLATNAGGTQVLRWGNARQLCLGLEVVTATGDVWDGLSGLRKDNSGYDLRDLFVGSEGTLGVITAATMTLFPQPTSTATAWATCTDLDGCLVLLALARSRAGPALTGFEVMSSCALDLVAKHFPEKAASLPCAAWSVLVELSGQETTADARMTMEDLLESAIRSGCVTDAVIAESVAQQRRLWEARESIPLAIAQAGPCVRHDISLPVSAIPRFVTETDRRVLESCAGAKIANFGHAGDGNLHYNILPPLEPDSGDSLHDIELRLNAIVFDAVVASRGSITAEHGVGVSRIEAVRQRKDPVALNLMRCIKRALDPNNLLNPGRVLDGLDDATAANSASSS